MSERSTTLSFCTDTSIEKYCGGSVSKDKEPSSILAGKVAIYLGIAPSMHDEASILTFPAFREAHLDNLSRFGPNIIGRGDAPGQSSSELVSQLR
jgi:hypothetical protein